MYLCIYRKINNISLSADSILTGICRYMAFAVRAYGAGYPFAISVYGVCLAIAVRLLSEHMAFAVSLIFGHPLLYL